MSSFSLLEPEDVRFFHHNILCQLKLRDAHCLPTQRISPGIESFFTHSRPPVVLVANQDYSLLVSRNSRNFVLTLLWKEHNGFITEIRRPNLPTCNFPLTEQFLHWSTNCLKLSSSGQIEFNEPVYPFQPNHVSPSNHYNNPS